MPAASQPPDKFTHALVTLQSLYETYAAPTLPPPLASLITTLFASAVQAQPYVSQLTSLLTSLLSTLSGVGGGSAEGTALVTTAITILSLYVGLRMFNYMRRMVMGWIIFAVKVVVVLVGVQVVVYVNRYGWENALRDASWLGGLVWGFVEEVVEGDKGGTRAPRGTRSRTAAGAGAGARRGQYGYQGREQGAVGGRARWN